MQGADIPPFPNGVNEDTNFGGASQCFACVEIFSGGVGRFDVTQQLGEIENAPGVGETGTCNHAVTTSTVSYTTNSVQLSNISGNGACFDVTMAFNGYSQEGRGSISPDGLTLTLELYFGGQASNHRCANGAVGSGGVVVNGSIFNGNARQTYRY